MRRTIVLTIAALAATLATAGTASADPCPKNVKPTSTLLNPCTFTVPSSVKAKDAVDGPISRIVNNLIRTVFTVKKLAEKPVDSKGIADNSIQLKDLSPTVRNMFNDTPAPAPTGGPPGYARVNSDGSIDLSASKNIELVSASAGLYCLRYTAGDPLVINLTLDISGADGRKVIIAGTAVKSAIAGGGDCGGATNIEVVTSNAVSQSATPAPFYLVVAA